MKYFYTCPLEAAYMAKRFGMRFCDRTGLSVSVDPSVWYMAERHYQAGSLCIHPDSLHLLEPTDGDLSYDGFVWNQKIEAWEKPTGETYNGQCLYLLHLKEKHHTAIRNGTHFMWPESEGE